MPIGPRFHEITSPVVLVCGCHLWHNFNDHCHCHCIQLDNEMKYTCFPLFPSKISWPYSASSACPWALSLPMNSGMLLYSTADHKSSTNDPDSIHGSFRGVSSTNLLCFVPHACISLLSSAFLASVHHSSHMAHATIAVLNLGPEGLSWNQFLLAVSARFSRIHFLHSGHRAVCVIFFLWKNYCSPFVKTKVASHCRGLLILDPSDFGSSTRQSKPIGNH